MAKIVYEIKGSDIYAWFEGLNSSYSRADRDCKWLLNNKHERIPHPILDARITNSKNKKVKWTGVLSNINLVITCDISAPGWSQTYHFKTETFQITNKVRPSKFSWTYAKSSGGAFNLMADEWEALQQNINKVREYKGMSKYAFTSVNSGDVFTADIYNEVIIAIWGNQYNDAIPGAGIAISQVNPGDTISAQNNLNNLINKLNNIT